MGTRDLHLAHEHDAPLSELSSPAPEPEPTDPAPAPEPEPAAAAAPEPEPEPEPAAAAEPEPEPAAAAEQPGVPVPFRAIPVDSLEFSPLAKEAKVYVSRVSWRGAGLLVQTPPLALLDPLVDADGEPAACARLVPKGALAKFLRDVEAALLAAVLARKAEWFRRGIPDDALRAGFKSLFSVTGPCVYRARVADEVAAFDAARNAIHPADLPPGTVRAVLALDRLCFGKTEFGGVWRLVQVQAVPPPKCLIDDSAGAAAAASDLHEFL